MALWLFISALLSLCLGAWCDTFYIAKAPSSVTFDPKAGQVPGDRLGDVVAMAMGFSVEEPLHWSGLMAGDLFNRPKGAFLVTVATSRTLPFPREVISYPANNVDWGMSEPLKSSLLSTFDSPLVISINPLAKEFESKNTGKDFADVEQLGRVEFADVSNRRSSLNASLQPDHLFLQEMEFLRLLREMLSTTTMDASPALVSVSLTGLAAVERLHGDEAKPTFDARQLLVTRITEVAMAVDWMCKGKALAVVATTDSIPEVVPLVQRNLLAADEKDPNLGYKYSSNYSVIFNIILWLCILLSLALILTAYSLASMDPGSDSLIYRVSSQRLKLE
uniref:renin receptor n=1 Tax=Myxine glutinosa TaxID=7769 RepID=UPI00358F648B